MSYYEAGFAQEFNEAGEFGEGEQFGAATEFGEFDELGESTESIEQPFGRVPALGGEAASGLSEAHEVELATELLEATNEAELEQFLGNVFKKVVRGAGTFVRSPIGRALGGVLKSVAKKALPVVGGALGSMVAPGIGTAIGAKLGSMAGGLFEIQTEGMPQEQAEFEVARRVVRLAAASARNAAAARPSVSVNPRTLARVAVARAARLHAPGIYRTMSRSLRAGAAIPGRHVHPGAGPMSIYGGAAEPPYSPISTAPSPDADGLDAADPAAGPAGEPSDVGAGMTGRWIRRGRKIIVLGA